MPSPANPADLPSRDQWKEASSRFAAQPLGDIALPNAVINFIVSLHMDLSLAQLVKDAAYDFDFPPGAF